MSIGFRTFRRLLGTALLAMGAGGCASTANSHGVPIVPPHPGSMVQMEVYDRASGTTLQVYHKDGRRYIVGTPGNEYALRIRNTSGGRILVVTSVDGVNVISGDTAAPSQSGYVLDPYGSVEVIGWRKSLERTAAFFFTEHQNSYASRTGRPHNVGVIGVAAFREKVQPVARYDFRRGQVASEAEPSAPAAADRSEAARGLPAEQHEDAAGYGRHGSRAPQPQAKLGTGHGRNETSHVRVVNFERASTSPAQTVTLQYDRRENLVAMGILPAPSVTYREPNPFPGMRFAPDPR